MASGANCIADENVKPHMRIPRSPLIIRKSPVCTDTMPRSRQWIASFANLPGVLAPPGEGAKQLDKKSFLNTKEAALHDDFMSTSNCSLRGKKIPIRSESGPSGRCARRAQHQRACTTRRPHADRHTLLGLYPVYWYSKFTGCQVNKLTPIRSRTKGSLRSTRKHDVFAPIDAHCWPCLAVVPPPPHEARR